MLKVRENVPAPTPEPLSPAAVSMLFQRIRSELQLPASKEAPKASPEQLISLASQRLDRRMALQAAGFPFASEVDYSAI